MSSHWGICPMDIMGDCHGGVQDVNHVRANNKTSHSREIMDKDRQLRSLQDKVNKLISVVDYQDCRLAQLEHAADSDEGKTQALSVTSNEIDTSVNSDVNNDINSGKDPNGVNGRTKAEIRTLASVVSRLVTRLTHDSNHNNHSNKDRNENCNGNDDEELKLLRRDIHQLVSNLEPNGSITQNDEKAPQSRHETERLLNQWDRRSDEKRHNKTLRNTDKTNDNNENNSNNNDENRVIFQESMYILLITENVLSRGFGLAIVITLLSTISLLLVVVNAFGDGSSSDNPLDIPVDVGLDVRIAQFIGTIIGILTEQESLQGIMLLAATHQGSLSLHGHSIPTWKLVFCSLCFITIGYLFLINLALVVAKADDVLSLFADILALEFVLNIDNATYQVVQSGIFGTRLQNAANEVGQVEVIRSRNGLSTMFKRHLPKFLYSLNVLGLVAWMVAVGIQQDKGTYGCASVMVTFGDETWEDVTITHDDRLRGSTSNQLFADGFYDDEEDRVLLYSYFNGVYRIDGTHDGHPRYVEQNKQDGRPFETTVGAEIVYCKNLNAWVFRHEFIRKSTSDLEEKECHWLMRSSTTQAFNLIEAAKDEWSSWVGEIESGSSISVVCNECERDSDCNYRGVCSSKTCHCDSGYFGQQCELELPCEVLVTDSGEVGEQTQLLIVKASSTGDEFVTSYNRPIYLMTGLSGIPKGLLGVSNYSESQYGNDDFFSFGRDQFSDYEDFFWTYPPSADPTVSAQPSSESRDKYARGANPSSTPSAAPSIGPTYSKDAEEEGFDDFDLFQHYTFVLLYSGSRWFGTMDRPDLDVRKVYDAEYHAFWQNTYRDRTFLVSAPSSNGSPVGVDFFAPRRRQDADREYGPFGVLLPHFSIPGVGFFQCYEFAGNCSILDIVLETSDDGVIETGLYWDLVWMDTNETVGEGDVETEFYRYRRCLADGLYAFTTVDDRICEGECQQAEYSIRVNENLLQLSNDKYFKSAFDFVIAASESDSAFCSQKENFRVVLQLDDWPHETTWFLFDAEGSLLMEGGPYPLSMRNKVLHHGACLSNGDYNFTLLDSHGDGLSDPGQITLLSEDTVVTSVRGGDFASILSVVFQLDSNDPDLQLTSDDTPIAVSCTNVTISLATNDDSVQITLWEESSDVAIIRQRPMYGLYELLCLKPGTYNVHLEEINALNDASERPLVGFDILIEGEARSSLYGQLNFTEIFTLFLPDLITLESFRKCNDEFSFVLVTDNYPEETSWNLVDSEDVVVASGGPYLNANSGYRHSVCLTSPQTYNFTIYDKYGDGLLGAGNYSATYHGRDVFHCSGLDCTQYFARSYIVDTSYDELIVLECPDKVASFVQEEIPDNEHRYDVSIVVATDEFPEETRWVLIGDKDKHEGGPYDEVFYVYRTDLCLSPGVYNFTIYDRYGDGIGCPGYYYILAGTEVLGNYTCESRFTETYVEINTDFLIPNPPSPYPTSFVPTPFYAAFFPPGQSPV